MDPIVNTLQGLGTFLFGVAARLGLMALFVAVLVVPVLAVVAATRGLAWMRRRSLGLEKVGGLFFRPGVHYASGHTWLEPVKGLVKVGLDDLAQQVLPCAVGVTLPHPGAVVRKGETAAVVACGGGAARIPAPIDGRIVKVNTRLMRDPSLVKHDNYARGWLFQMEPVDDKYIELPLGPAARKWLTEEGLRFDRFLETHLGTAAADGGDWIAPAPALLSAEQWDELVRTFLKE